MRVCVGVSVVWMCVLCACGCECGIWMCVHVCGCGCIHIIYICVDYNSVYINIGINYLIKGCTEVENCSLDNTLQGSKEQLMELIMRTLNSIFTRYSK